MAPNTPVCWWGGGCSLFAMCLCQRLKKVLWISTSRPLYTTNITEFDLLFWILSVNWPVSAGALPEFRQNTSSQFLCSRRSFLSPQYFVQETRMQTAKSAWCVFSLKWALCFVRSPQKLANVAVCVISGVSLTVTNHGECWGGGSTTR